ncbi:hypothetical protein GFGA_1d0539 [Gluconobacter frateurii NBRC 103465]|nr:hypothetical protein GFGA_1d0539 [Gluconobacter frateurii NBRC 103465]
MVVRAHGSSAGTGMEIPDRAAAVSGIRAAQPEDTALAGNQASAS